MYVEKSSLIIRDDSVVNYTLEVSGSILTETPFSSVSSSDKMSTEILFFLNPDSFIKRSTYIYTI